MESNKINARHVFHPATSGTDRMHAWQEATGEPVFAWGSNSGYSEGYFLGSVKRDFLKWLNATGSADITVYHDGMGADAFGPLDPATNKVLFMHNWFPRWEKNFEWMLRCTGKVLVGHSEQMDTIRNQFEWIPEKYIHQMNQPCFAKEPTGEQAAGPKQRTGIWIHGKKWKRYGNRLRAVLDRWLPEAGELEVVTNGAKVPSWAQKDHVTWSGDLPLHFALMRIHTWDSCMLLNDFSLDMPWLVRALELGCFPLIPAGSGVARADNWKMDSAPQPYEWGDVESAVNLLTQWRENRTSLQDDFQKWAMGLVDQYGGNQFIASWKSVKKEILRTRPPRLRQRKPAGNSHPVGWYERVQRLRSGT